MNQLTDAQAAEAIQQMLQDLDLKGRDVPAFVAIWNWLETKKIVVEKAHEQAD